MKSPAPLRSDPPPHSRHLHALAALVTELVRDLFQGFKLKAWDCEG